MYLTVFAKYVTHLNKQTIQMYTFNGKHTYQAKKNTAYFYQNYAP